MSPRITPCLWFDDQAEEAAEFYTSIFPNSRIIEVARYGEAGPREPGMVMTVAFELDGQPFTALNGGSQYQYTHALSLQNDCETQEEVDHFYDHLLEGGKELHCGWVADRYGVPWQVVPKRLNELLSESDPETSRRVTESMLKMMKIDIATLEDAAARTHA